MNHHSLSSLSTQSSLGISPIDSMLSQCSNASLSQLLLSSQAQSQSQSPSSFIQFIFVLDDIAKCANKKNVDVNYQMDQAFDDMDSLIRAARVSQIDMRKTWTDASKIDTFLPDSKSDDVDDHDLERIDGSSDSPILQFLISSQSSINSAEHQSQSQSQPGKSTDENCLRKYFVISCFEGELYQRLFDSRQNIVGPLAISYWKRFLCDAVERQQPQPPNHSMIGDHQNFDDTVILRRKFAAILESNIAKISAIDSLFSECMHANVVYISRLIAASERYALMIKIKRMGGDVSGDFNCRVTHVVVGDLDTLIVSSSSSSSSSQSSSSSSALSQKKFADSMVNAAYLFQIPILSINWIDLSWIPVQMQIKLASEISFVRSKMLNDLFNCVRPSPLLTDIHIAIFDQLCDNEDNSLRSKLDKLIYVMRDLVARLQGRFIVKSKDFLQFSAANLIIHPDDLDLAAMQGDDDDRRRRRVYQRYADDHDFGRFQKSKPGPPVPIVTITWLIDSIVREAVQPYAPYRVDKRSKPSPHPSSTSSSSTPLKRADHQINNDDVEDVMMFNDEDDDDDELSWIDKPTPVLIKGRKTK